MLYVGEVVFKSIKLKKDGSKDSLLSVGEQAKNKIIEKVFINLRLLILQYFVN